MAWTKRGQKKDSFQSFIHGGQTTSGSTAGSHLGDSVYFFKNQLTVVSMVVVGFWFVLEKNALMIR